MFSCSLLSQLTNFIQDSSECPSCFIVHLSITLQSPLTEGRCVVQVYQTGEGEQYIGDKNTDKNEP